MTSTDHRLARDLAITLLIKLLALLAIWWWLVRDVRVEPDADDTAARIAAPVDGSAQPQGARP